MVSMRVLEKVDYGKLIRFNPTRCSSPAFQGVNLLSQKGGDVFISSADKLKKEVNPLLEAVKKAVPFEKEPRIKLADSLHDLVIDSTKTKTNSMGKDALVFPIPNHDNLVLRVEKTALKKLEQLPEDLELVPISYEKSIMENPHLGVPLYIVVPKSSQLTKKNTISSLEAMAQKDKIMVLRKVTGKHPATECGEKFLSMIGLENIKDPDPDALNNFSYIFGYLKDNFDYSAVQKCMEMFKNGETFIPAHALAEGSAPFEIVKGKEFYAKYKDFAESYIKSLKDISEIPQGSYDEAVTFVAKSKCFNLDFQHTNNTFVDVEKQEFNFVDLAYNKNDWKYVYDNPVKEFRNVLFGKHFRKIAFLSDYMHFLPCLETPRDFIVAPEHIMGVKKYSRVINDKINLAAPDEFKCAKVFS